MTRFSQDSNSFFEYTCVRESTNADCGSGGAGRVALDRQPPQPPAGSNEGGAGLNRPIVRPFSPTKSLAADAVLSHATLGRIESDREEGGADDDMPLRRVVSCTSDAIHYVSLDVIHIVCAAPMAHSHNFAPHLQSLKTQGSPPFVTNCGISSLCFFSLPCLPLLSPLGRS